MKREPDHGNGKLDALLEGYLDYLADIKRLAAGTIIDVRSTLHRVSEAMLPLIRETPLWKAKLTDWVRWVELQGEAGRRPSSLQKELSHVRGFLEYAFRSGRSDRNVLEGFTLADGQEQEEPESLSIEEAKKLVEGCPSATALERRDRLVILLLYGCGVRTKELCQLDVTDVDRERREVKIRQAKGDRERIVPIPDGVHTEVLAYLLERGGKRGALFRTARRQRRISSKEVGRIVHEAAERAGLGRSVTPKVLRHSYATHLMDRGVDLAVIARLMGHRSPRETGVYLHVLQGRMQSAVDRLKAREASQEGEATK